MFIGVTGYGGTGASACIDLLKEFDGVQFYPKDTEFQILQQPDGIADLRFQLVESRRRIGINAAIVRFLKQSHFKRSDRISAFTNNAYPKLSEDYIHSLIQVQWKGKSRYDPQDIVSPLEKPQYRYLNAILRRIVWKISLEKDFPPTRDRYYCSVSEDEFIEKTKAYLTNIFKASGFDLDKPILLEQLFCLERPTDGSEYLDGDYRSIIVDRDPRDIYTLVTLYWGKKTTAFMPNDNDVKKFVAYYKGLHHNRSDSDKVYYLQFEDLIYRYDETAAFLSRFTGLKHVNPLGAFRPEQSINNTKLYEKHPEIAEDISYIEKELKEYLYPFKKYEKQLTFEREEHEVFDNRPGDMEQALRLNKRK